MLRTVEISLPPERTDPLLAQLRTIDGLFGLRVERGIGVQPPGDVISAQVAGLALHRVMQLLESCGVMGDPGASITTTEPLSVVNPPGAAYVARTPSETTWEEMEAVLGKESNMSVNGILLMAAAGIIAAIGLASDTLHYVIAAMVIAPGFEPIVRIALGSVTGSAAWRRGLSDLALGYLALVAGAALTSVVLEVEGPVPFAGQSAYLDPGRLIPYWMTFSSTSIAVDFVAGIAGALLVVSGRSVLTAGVLIALSLIPSAALVGMGIGTADANMIAAGAGRWALNVVLILLAALAVLAWKRRTIQRRRALL